MLFFNETLGEMIMFLQQLVTGISVGGIYALLATGYSLIYSLLDFSNWAHGEFAMVNAYVAVVLSSFLGLPFVVAAVGGMLGGALVSYLCERMAYRRIRSNGAPNMFLMIAAMGLSNVFQQAANLIFSGQYRSYPFKPPVSTVKVATAYIGVLDLVSLAITAVVIVLLVYLINKTQFGLNVRAIAQQALQLQREQDKAARSRRSREDREAEADRQFALRQEKRRENHKGH